MRRCVSIAGLAAALVLGTLGFGTGQKSYVASAQEKTSAMEVKIDNFSFGPVTLTVPVGATVTWTNRDEETHTITSTTGAFASAGLGNAETFAQTFTRPGTYEYFCALHPKMRATVIVK